MSEPHEYEPEIDASSAQEPAEATDETATTEATDEIVGAESGETPIAKEPKKPRTDREIERKLRVPPLFTLPPITGEDTGVARVVARPPFVLTAAYYDTDDLRLARWGVTFRRREGGSDAGWHLKLPVAGGHPGDRDEVTLPLDAGEPGNPPSELVELVSALVRGAPLREVATLRTERTPFLLRDHDDRLIAELVDDVVSVLDGERVAGRFREIEVEARDGDTDDLDRVLTVLLAAGAEPGTTSKAAHALGPRATAPPDVPAPVTIPGPRDPASAAVHVHLLSQARRLLLNDVRMRRDLPDAVHQMRVAARRLRSSMRTFRPLVDREWADHLRDELGWLAGELGAIRDTEVLLKRLDAHCDLIDDQAGREAARGVVDRALGAQLVTARASALEALRSERYRTLLDVLVVAVREPAFTDEASRPARAVLPALSWDAWKRLKREGEWLTHDTEAEQWHRTRIIAKRARYAAEALEPVFGADAQTLAQSLEAVTELLGEHQDASVAQDAIRLMASDPTLTGVEGWGLGLLHGVEIDSEQRSRIEFIPVWAAAVKAHRRSRLR